MKTSNPENIEGFLNGFQGFTPIDELAARRLPERWRSWGRCGAMIQASLCVVLVLGVSLIGGRFGATGSLGADLSSAVTDIFFAVTGFFLWACIGWLNGAFLGWCADRMCRRKDEAKLAEHDRKEEEDRIWARRLMKHESSRA